MPGGPHLSRSSSALLCLPAGAAVVLLTAGCSRPVAIADPDPGPSAAALCRSLMAELPEEVLDEGRRRVEPGSLSAAWGNPTITLRCGVPRPPTLTAGSPCFEVNSVGWFAEEASGGYLFTTIGRAAFVEVGVPATYAPEATALVDLADAVSEHVPRERPCL